MTTHAQYCPVARSADILGDRWTLLIVRDLLAGVEHFNDLERDLPGISRAVLSERLRRLRQAGIIERQTEGEGRGTCYHLTEAGAALEPVIEALRHWGTNWGFGAPDPAQPDALALLGWLGDHAQAEQLPAKRVVVEFQTHGVQQGRYWAVVEPDNVSLCVQHPGFDVDVVLRANLAHLYAVWLGQMTFEEAVGGRHVILEGPPSLTAGLSHWFTWTSDGVDHAENEASGLQL